MQWVFIKHLILIFAHSHPPTFSHSHLPNRPPTFTRTYSPTLTLPLSPALTLTHARTLTLPLSLTLPLAHTQSHPPSLHHHHHLSRPQCVQISRLSAYKPHAHCLGSLTGKCFLYFQSPLNHHIFYYFGPKSQRRESKNTNQNSATNIHSPQKTTNNHQYQLINDNYLVIIN